MKIGAARDDATPAGAPVPPVGPQGLLEPPAARADPGVPCPPLAGDTTADVCIIGGGFAGLWTAYELSERAPQLGVVLLEADVCGARSLSS